MYAGFPAALLWLDKRTSHIAVLDKGCTIRNPGCQRIAKCCSISGLRHTCHQICLYRGILCQKLSGLDPACIYTHPVNMTVRSCKIDVLKNTACFLFFRKCHGHIGLNTFFRRNGHNFSRQHITHKCCTNGVKCTGFRRAEYKNCHAFRYKARKAGMGHAAYKTNG